MKIDITKLETREALRALLIPYQHEIYGKLLFEWDIEPMGAPRQNRGTNNKATRRYNGEKGKQSTGYKFQIKQAACIEQFNPPTYGFHLVFAMPIVNPAKADIYLNQEPLTSWYGFEDRHLHTPDSDNLAKGWLDAMFSKAGKGDCNFGVNDQHIHSFAVTKKWALNGYIRLYQLSDRVRAEMDYQD